MRANVIPALAAAIFIQFTASWAVKTPASQTARVLVVQNTNSPISKAIAADYMTRRGVTNLLSVNCQDAALKTDSETITFRKYLSKIDAPLRAYLATNPGIDYIVLTKGVPLRLMGSEYAGWSKALDSSAQYHNSSVDGYISAFGYDTIKGAIRIIVTDTAGYGKNFYGLSWSNRYWNSTKPFSHAVYGGYIVMRLDGYTQAEAINLTTLSLAADSARQLGKKPAGKILLDECPDYGSSNPLSQPYSILKADPPVNDTSKILKESYYGDYNGDMQLAANMMKSFKVPDTLNTNATFVGNLTGLMGYISWGSNDTHYSATSYLSLRFMPGAICETAVSTSARTFLPTSGGQSLVVDIIHQGATGMKGDCDEPFLQATASPSILYSRYTTGWDLAESYAAACNEVGWEDIVIGDPLCIAYPDTTASAVLFPNATAVNPSAPISISQNDRGVVFTVGGNDGVSSLSLTITSLQGKIIRKLTGPKGNQSVQQLTWDFSGNSGRRVQPGTYAYRVSRDFPGKSRAFEGKFTVTR